MRCIAHLIAHCRTYRKVTLSTSITITNISPINYYDFTPYDTDDSYLDFNTTPPYELFIKSKADFGYQNELRIVINSHNPDILRQFDSPIEIGNLSDIANVADHYLSDGIEITATFDTYITP